ncbi:unnamed protein product [Sphenostylis stenocarpa]|uniref:EF-hand domain-containing protein n=1 Tax=Sphenostylis stenocarpa TaxID=92480 RepID=A0AA86SSR7_9FABA|nr:unnamed protein product [Sphenostylis stenocarpa]
MTQIQVSCFKPHSPYFSARGKISASDIKRIGKELGQNFTDREIQEMVDEADQANDREVSPEEFIKMMNRTRCHH